ncbi:hypothetical protein KY359_04990, partial [Candidatus Woesearchaeota archaeon]|nr:hypothetical protein [Candidatus Woesearchaeota archaeon]
DICNWAYGGRQCLYVHSAAYKISGDSVVGKILAGVVEYLMTQLIGSLASLGLRKLGCAYPHGIKDWSKIGDGVKKECEESLSGSSAADSVEAVEAAVDTAIGEGAGMEPLEGEPTEEAEEAGEEAEDAGDEAGEAGEEGGETPAASTDSPLPQKSLYSHICGLTMAMLIWQDVGDWLDFESDFDLNYYEQQLSDPDYCGG